MGHDHGHGAGVPHRGRLLAAFGLTLGVLAVEVAGALATGSLALLSDAGHVLTDVLGLGMALAAVTAAARGATDRQRSFGLHRLEILAALANAVLLVGVAGYVLVEAAGRLGDPPAIAPGPVLAVAAVGLAANVVAWLLLRPAARDSLNVRGASLEVAADTVGSVGVVAAAGVTAVTGWPYADPIVAAAIGLWILPRTWALGREALRILVQAAPDRVPLDEVRRDLAGLHGVVDVHDLHVWTLTSDKDVASAHLMIRAGADGHEVLDQARDLLAARHRIVHATLQVEPDTHRGCDELAW